MRGSNGRALRWRLWMWIAGIIVLAPDTAGAIASFRYDGPATEVIGVEGAPALILIDGHFARDGFRWFVEASEKRLFDVDGLTASLFRAALRWSAVGMLGSVAQLSSPVGAERMVRLEPFASHGNAFGMSVVGSVHTVMFPSYRDLHVVSVGVRMFLRLSRVFTLGYGIENYRVWGEALPGAEMSLQTVVRPQQRVTVVMGARTDRNGMLGLASAVYVTVREKFGVAIGYDDGAETFRAALRFDLPHVGVTFGAGVHSVLGVSRAASFRLRG